MRENDRVLITGGHSAVAVALREMLAAAGYKNVATPDRTELELTNPATVKGFFQNWKPDYVCHIAGRTTTTAESSSAPWDVFRDNLLMEYNVFEASIQTHIKKMIWIASDSAFPYSSNAKIQTEDDLFQGPLKKEVEPYAFAKLVGIKMCEYLAYQKQCNCFVSLLPCYIYGNIEKGLLYALINDFITAKRDGRKEVRVWGKGDLQYRLIHCCDVASAILFAMNHQMKYDKYVVAPTETISKKELSKLISSCVGYEGTIIFDESKRVLPATNASPARLCVEGWMPKVPLHEGIREYINWLAQNSRSCSGRS